MKVKVKICHLLSSLVSRVYFFVLHKFHLSDSEGSVQNVPEVTGKSHLPKD